MRALLALLFVLFPLIPAEAATTRSVAYAGHVPLAGYETRLMYQPSPREGLPAGFRGSAVVRPSPGGGVVGIANVAATAGGGDRLLAYEPVAVRTGG